MKSRVIAASAFKAKCLALLDEVAEQGATITVTKRGLPVAVIAPAPKTAWKSPKNCLAGKVRIVGDIVNFDSSERWHALRPREGLHNLIEKLPAAEIPAAERYLEFLISREAPVHPDLLKRIDAARAGRAESSARIPHDEISREYGL